MKILYKRLSIVIVLILISFFTYAKSERNPSDKIKTSIKLLEKEMIENSFRFLVINDAGKNGYGDQKAIAETMGEIADKLKIKNIFSAGDQLHYRGIQHLHDPFWITNFEIIYTNPSLIDANWYAIAGNHEYRGNVDAFINYGKISSRWKAPSRYYELKFHINDNDSIQVIMLDTTPMMDRYRNNFSSDASKQDIQRQILWTDSILSSCNAKWKLVIGHHPIVANTSKNLSERIDMQKRLYPTLEKNKIDLYISGHIHNFQHVKKKSSSIDFIVNTSAASSRSIKDFNDLIFGSNDTGFILGEVTQKRLIIRLINKNGEILYTHKIDKK